MTEKSIQFTAKDVRAILDGRTNIFRKAVNPHIVERFVLNANGKLLGSFRVSAGDVYPTVDDAPYEVGDILWVQEPWREQPFGYDPATQTYSGEEIEYRADFTNEENALYGRRGGCSPRSWRPSNSMPRSAARLYLRITDVQIERVQDTSAWEWVYQFEKALLTIGGI